MPSIVNKTLGHGAIDELWPHLDRRFSQDAFRDHARILEAITARQGARAENMMKEHVFSSREKARRVVERLTATAS